MSPKETGAFISLLRKEAGITQQELAEKLNVTAKAVSRWETGKGYPDVTILPKLSELFNVSVNEILNGKRCAKEEMAVLADKTILTVCHRSNVNKRRIIYLIITVTILFTIVLGLLCFSVFSGIAKSLEGEPYAVLSYDLSHLTYYDEQYVPLDIQGFSCRLGEELVDEVKLENGSLIDKLLSQYALQSVQGVADNELIYLRSEHDIDFYVKESAYEEYQKMLKEFEPETAYVVYEQSNGYEKELKIEDDLFSHLCSLSEEDADTNLTCEYQPEQKRMTVIAYDNDRIIYKEYGDIFIVNGQFYWYDYADSEYPDSVAYQYNPYKISERYYGSLEALFSY